MKYDDLESTQDLFDTVDVPTPIRDIEMEGASKEDITDELGLVSDNASDAVGPMKEEKVESLIKEKKSFKDKWNDMSKKKKVILIVSIVVLLLIVIGLILFFVLKSDKKPKTNDGGTKAPEVIVEKENYIYQDGVLKLLDDKEKELGTYECKNKEEKLCYVVNYSDEDTFDIEKNVFEDESVIPRGTKIYFDRYVFIYDNEKAVNGTIILYDIATSEEKGEYSLVKGFADSNEVILKDLEDNYGMLEFSDGDIKEKVSFAFDYLGTINKDSNLVGKTKNKYGIYDKTGKAVSATFSGEIKNFNESYIVVSQDDKYNVYDYKGKKVFSSDYDYIRLYNDFAVLIKDSKLYIRDYKDQKYMEDGIEIEADTYNTLNIYDEDKVKKETKEAFRIDFNGDELDIVYKVNNRERTKTINLKDASLSANLKYLSYLDGKLYFYQDEEKQELFGTYTCTNKNSGTLNNCVIASDAIYGDNGTESDNSANGWIPIFNRQYVFIYDSNDKNDPTVLLYDLKTSKVLSRYASVSTGVDAKAKELTFKNTSQTYIIAKNKNNEFGMIRLGGEVKSGIPFEYSYVKKLKDYYVALDNNGKYSLMTENGSTLASSIEENIIDYKNNYVITLNNDLYNIYSFAGDKITLKGYKNVSLESDYYTAITSENTLFIGKYSSNDDYKIAKEDIKVSSISDYSVVKSEGYFKVTINSTNESFEFDINTGELKTDEVIPDIPVDSNDNNDNQGTEE